jgi:hypothetical protein
VIKLKKIISHLDDALCKTIEEGFEKNKAENFLYLFRSYRSEVDDEEIQKTLKLSSNSFYVLKSRLFDRIQEHLSGDIHQSRELLLKKLNEIPELCVTEPREVAIAYLQKLEKDLLEFDMHNELFVVYSALKKANLYSDRYFHYSQLYNKHIAFSLSLEKSEEILGNFTQMLGQYDFSRSQRLLDTLLFLRKDIGDHYTLNPSRQIEITRNFIELQLGIFCDGVADAAANTAQLLSDTRKLIDELPQSSQFKSWIPALNYLSFEYYYKTGQAKQAAQYFEQVESKLQTLLLYTNICKTSKFLASRIAYLQEQGRQADLSREKSGIEVYDEADVHSRVLLGIYNAMIAYFAGNIKESCAKLNEVLNENSFKDYFHINTEVKLSLAYMYLQQKEYDLADSIIKSIYRKIKSEKIENYPNVLNLIKVFEQEIKEPSNKASSKQKDDFTLFAARNSGPSSLLKHLAFELKKKYS